ncbi:pilus assembly protein N-terminal domain-containing protein [Enterovirga sp.]|mgnify:CR=1 FL=1|uniref:pilus assembly protein N-terminal domain-containing protein n=1 Tax=Enterovirga sp. TaxID=2026350 RepID=UPI002C99D6C1|nr:pilus assembly protein N-terminal domain-containing protein [Enterovirga sp.]HMO28078.1 pilus assembly protein N-terminal domain-containing protein [Enterovirga sp.]
MRPQIPTAFSAALVLALAAGSAAARDGVRLVHGVPAPLPASAGTESAPPAEAPAPSASSAPPAAAVERGGLFVTINRAKVIRLPERVQTVIVGNPAIADLSVQKNGIVVVTGKSYGATNLIALDAAGNMLAESLVNVVAQTDGLVILQKADRRYSYSCNPVCQPSVNLGDDKTYFDDARGQADSHNQFAVSR